MHQPMLPQKLFLVLKTMQTQCLVEQVCNSAKFSTLSHWHYSFQHWLQLLLGNHSEMDTEQTANCHLPFLIHLSLNRFIVPKSSGTSKSKGKRGERDLRLLLPNLSFLKVTFLGISPPIQEVCTFDIKETRAQCILFGHLNNSFVRMMS